MYKFKKIEAYQIRLTAEVIAAFTIFAFSVMAFVRIAWDVREKETPAFDTVILKAIHSFSNSFLDTFIPVATDIGGMVGVAILTLLVLVLFVYKKEYRRALLVAVSVAGAASFNLILKSVFERARPELWDKLVNEASYSFPSGHAMASAALGVAVAVALWQSRWRWWGLGASAAYILFVGYTRLYLGVHYPTDVLAGWFVSSAWVMAVALLLHSRLSRKALRGVK